MQSRRHVVVAIVIVTMQALSLIVATDILGADVSSYATPSGTVEATGAESDLDEDPDGNDRSTLVTEELVIGQEQPPEQLAVTDAEADPVDQPTPPVPAAGEAPVETEQTETDSQGPESVDTPPTETGPTETGPAETGPTETAPVETAPAEAAPAAGSLVTDGSTSTTTSTAPTSTSPPTTQAPPTTAPSSSTSTSTTTTLAPRTVPAGPEPTSAVASTASSTTTTTTTVAPATIPPTPSTTWLPATTSAPITTWTVTTTATTTTTTIPTTPVTTQPTTTAPPTTVPSTTKPATTAPPTTSTAPSSGSSGALEAIRNSDPRFSRYASVPSASLSLAALTEPAPVKDNGTVGDGQFRAACQYSHFAYDDPIVFPGQPGRSHLHMFFGNTETDAFSTTNSIVNSGGGSCNGFELNRSAYWTPALLDGKGNAVVPDMIILYYKTKETGQVQRMPQGLKMVSGNTSAESFTVSDFLYWSCGDSGHAYNKSNRIPNCNGDTINATISFPQCWDGRNMDSANHRSHMALVSPHRACPSSHPVRLPQISILLYFPGVADSSDWYLSSDRSGGFNTGPGATLHADWWGGWNDETMDLWTNGCMKAARNCSFGQTGTDRQLAKLNNFQTWPGDNFLPLP